MRYEATKTRRRRFTKRTGNGSSGPAQCGRVDSSLRESVQKDTTRTNGLGAHVPKAGPEIRLESGGQ
jgi:hypothetical protein